MYKFQKPTSRCVVTPDKKTSLPRAVAIKDYPDDEDEVDRATPSQSLFDPNSTSTSIYDYEDDYGDANAPAQDYCSLPVQVAHLNNLDSVYFSSATHQDDDVGDFITTLDESCSSADDFIGWTVTTERRQKPRPKSMYTPGVEMFGPGEESLTTSAGPPVEKWAKIMTTSCYGALTPENLNRIGSEHQLDISSELSPFTLAQLDGNQRQWMASTEELMRLNRDFESQIQKRVAVDVHHGIVGDLNSSITDDNLVSLENSYCEPQSTTKCGDLAERAESDLQSIRKLLGADAAADTNISNTSTGGGLNCPSCDRPFDKGKKRKLIDTCGHERCYSCMFKNEKCPICCSTAARAASSTVSKGSDIYKSSTNVNDSQLYAGPRNGPSSRFGSVSQLLQISRKEQKESGAEAMEAVDKSSSVRGVGREDPRIRVCAATPPQTQRRFFSPKLKSPFNKRRIGVANFKPQSSSTKILSGLAALSTTSPATASSEEEQQSAEKGTSMSEDESFSSTVYLRRKNDGRRLKNEKLAAYRQSLSNSTAYAGHLSSLVFGKIKSLWSAQASTFNLGLNQFAEDDDDSGAFQYRTPDLEGNSRASMKEPMKSYSSLASTNTSPVSTLTGSSDVDMCRVLQDSGIYTAGSNSIGSIMSMSEKSTSSLSPVIRRHSLTASQNSEDHAPFKNRMVPHRRSARTAVVTTRATVESQQQLRSPHLAAQLTLKPLFFEVPTQEVEPQFSGRQWLLRDISTTLNHAESQGVLIQGGPGAGKTAFCLQLVEHSCFGRRRNCQPVDPDAIYSQINPVNDRIKALSAHIVAYHFCQADNNSTCLVPDFIHSLAAQLCQAPQLSAYRDYLLGEADLANVLSERECIADPERAMKMGILEPLISLKKTGNIASKTCVLLIDGICEAEYHRPDQGDTIGSFLARMVTYFPPWLKIIGTVRTQMMEHVRLTALPRFNLDGHSEAVQKDVFEYCSHRIRTNTTIQNNIQVPGESAFSVQSKFVQYLMNLAKGSYLFVKLSLDLIESGHLIIKSNTFKVVPVSLSQVFLLKFNLKFPTTTKFERVANVLNICLASLYPLTQSELFYTLNAMQTQAPVPWTEFVEICNELSEILVKRSDGTFMFFHPSVREWLIRRDASESTKFLCDSRVGHSAIAFRLSRLQAPLDAEQILELGHHILKAHIYRNSNTGVLPRDMQAFWLTSVARHIESSLCSLRNVYSPNVKVSRLLLLAGASANYATDILGQAPILLIAASEGITAMVNLLLEFGADIENTNSQGSTALILASARGHYDVVRQLVASGASSGHTDNSKRCALVHAARAGKLNIIKYLLSCDWLARANSDDIQLAEAVQQALVCAASEGFCEMVEELLEVSQVKIDGQDSITGETALVAAAKNGHIDIITCLLARGARVDGTNKKGVSALIAAAKEGHGAAVERLLQFSAVDLGQRDDEGKTALIYASQENHMEIVNLFLVQEGVDTELVDNEGMTALSWSCLRGHLSATTVLLDNSSNIHHTDGTGRTPLDLAAYQGSAALAQLLIDRGSTLEHVDLNGMRPLDRAIACRNIQIVPVFLKKGAKLGPATWEMAFGKPEILLLLLNKLLEDGNTLYRKNRLQEASHRYQYALKKFPAGPTDHLKTFTQLKSNFLLNYSRCNRKMKNIAEAIDLASDAIQLNPNNYEGFHLRAKSYMEQGDFEMALADSKTALKLSQMTATAEIKTILIRYHDEVVRLQASQTLRTTDL